MGGASRNPVEGGWEWEGLQIFQAHSCYIPALRSEISGIKYYPHLPSEAWPGLGMEEGEDGGFGGWERQGRG